jgi:hypothetical protein
MSGPAELAQVMVHNARLMRALRDASADLPPEDRDRMLRRAEDMLFPPILMVPEVLAPIEAAIADLGERMNRVEALLKILRPEDGG